MERDEINAINTLDKLVKKLEFATMLEAAELFQSCCC